MTRESLKGAYSEGEALAIYQELKDTGNFVDFCETMMRDEDYQVARNALWGLTKASNSELMLAEQPCRPRHDYSQLVSETSVTQHR